MKKSNGQSSQVSFHKLMEVVSNYRVMDSKSFLQAQQSKTNISNSIKNVNNTSTIQGLTHWNRQRLGDQKRQSSTKENIFSIQLKNIVQNSDRNGIFTERVNKTSTTPKSQSSQIKSLKFQTNLLSDRQESEVQQDNKCKAKSSNENTHRNLSKSIGRHSDSIMNSIERLKSKKHPSENTFHLKLNSVPKFNKNISFTGREKDSKYNLKESKDNKENKEHKELHDIKALQSQLSRMIAINRKAGSFTGRANPIHSMENKTVNEDISVHLKNLINFCNQSIRDKEKTLTLDTEEAKQPIPIRNQIKTLNIDIDENDVDKESLETARFNQEDGELRKMKEMLASKMSKKRELLNSLIQSQINCDKSEPYIPTKIHQHHESMITSNDSRYCSKGMQKLVQSKSISPTHTSEYVQRSLVKDESNDAGYQFQRIIDQLCEAQIKPNAQNLLVRVAQISIDKNLEPNKINEKKVKLQITNIHGLRIKNEKQIPLSIPSMKAFFSTSLLYLNLSNNGIKQNSLQLSLKTLQYVDLSFNQLENLMIISGCTGLLEIQASINSCLRLGNNIIGSVDGLNYQKSLTILELSCNEIKNFETILQLKKNDSIKQINLESNPVSKYPNFKRFIKQILPNCVKVDGEILEGTNKILFTENKIKTSLNRRYCHYDEYQQQIESQAN